MGLRASLRDSSSLQLLKTRGTPSIAITSAVGRLPVSMASLALLLSLSPSLGLTTASVASAAFGIGFAAFATLKGRWIDRQGPRWTLRVLTLPSTASLLWIASGPDSSFLVVSLAMVAGATMPPVAPATRALWVRRFPSGSARHGAMSLDAVISELAIVLGSAAVAAVAAAGAEWTLVATAVLAVVGVWTFSSLPSLIHRSTPAPGRQPSQVPLNRRAVFLVTTHMCLVPAGIGAVIVSLTQLGDAKGGPGAGAWLVTATAVGSVASSILVTTVLQQKSHMLVQIWRRLVKFTLLFAVALAAFFFIGEYKLLFALSVVAYAFVAPIYVGQSEILGWLAPTGRENELFSIGPTTNWVGQSAGIVLMGYLVNTFGFPAALTLPPLLIALAGVIAMLGVKATVRTQQGSDHGD